MKFSKLDLLTLLISLFLFASCKNSDSIGLEDPATAIQGNLIDSVSINSTTVKDDPASTLGMVRYPLGYLNDPVLGTSDASLAMSVNLPEAAYSFGANAVIDSAVLVLPYSNEFYGDSTSTFTINVHQLSKDLSVENSFMSNKEWAHEATPIGSYSGQVRPGTPVKVTTVVTGGPDTLITAAPQLRIKLDKAFVQANIADLSAGSLVNNPSFNSAFKGLHVSVDQPSGTGGLMFFDFSNTGSKLEIYYKRQNATTPTDIDTVDVSFPINQTNGPIAATVHHNYTNTDVATQLSNPTIQYDVTYLQSMGGLRNKITFPYLKDLITNLDGKIIINKAELVIDLSSGTDVAPFNAGQRLSLYRYDIAGQRSNLPDNNPSTQNYQGDPRAFGNFGGGFDATNKRYTFIVTAYIQDLIDGKTQDYGTFLAPSAVNEFNLLTPLTSGARTIIGSFKNSTNKIRLNIYYTKIK